MGWWEILAAVFIAVVAAFSGGGGGGDDGGSGGGAPVNPMQDQIIMLDPGHGLGYPGEQGAPGEADVVHNIADKLEPLLEQDGATVYITPSYEDVDQRAQYANDKGANILVSIHANSFYDPAVNGVESFYGTVNNAGSGGDEFNDKNLCGFLQPQVAGVIPSTSRGVKPDTETADTALGILRKTNMPACLVEIEFISCMNFIDYKGQMYDNYSQLLQSDQYQKDVAEAFHTGIKEYFGATAGPSTSAKKRVVAMPEFGPIALTVVILGGLAVVFLRK